jgi:hypothetical protein
LRGFSVVPTEIPGDYGVILGDISRKGREEKSAKSKSGISRDRDREIWITEYCMLIRQMKTDHVCLPTRCTEPAQRWCQATGKEDRTSTIDWRLAKLVQTYSTFKISKAECQARTRQSDL